MKELKIIFIIFTFTLLARSSPEDEWQAFKYRYLKRYYPEEEHNRMSIFMNNLKIIEKYQKEDPDAVYGITKFTDLTQEEFKLTYLGLDPSLPKAKPPLQSIDTIPLDKIEIPSTLDWRELGAVTPAKNQAICGSCWAFSAIGNIEGQYFLKQNTLRNLSEQELVDCDKLDQGCNGGYMQNAFTWLSENGGCEPSESYPYFGFENTCKINVGAQIVKVKGYVNISSDEDTVAQTLYTTGPLSTGINGNKLQFYKSGIFSPLTCSNELNHGVLFVGYGSEEKRGKNVDYWIIKNSWGADWGENGYFRIVKGKGKCGINLDVSTSILE